MSVQQQVLQRAASRIGYYAPADPQVGSEAARYWYHRGRGAWLLGPSTRIWWCMLFVSMCLDECGQVGAIGGYSSHTDTTIAQARRAGCQLVPVSQAAPGDVVIFNWDGGATDHVGLVERNLGGGVLQTIEGNTSSGAKGSQSAGNGVWRRRRSRSIAAVIRPRYTGAPASPAHPASDALAVDGWVGPATVRALQALLGTPVDGVVSSQYTGNRKYVPAATSGWVWTSHPTGSTMVRGLQSRLGVTADGILGPDTIRAWQSRLGVAVDGYLGAATARAIQTALNAGRLW
ncbi:MAG: CHAP domain-containing protein [Actinomyces urogenitalis]|uniref:CHAP domain-containing protein n=1 Tax=Actinomyces urogenitalis TaxID=103621 RepID=UPI0024328DBE|nr:CHAP domain-containing protein [Actinomyces urogenitalis]MBS5975985.1 CHAP domain-containing protein [Actinomyces urogenitalis]MDU0972834.1 CHAP domain-containing protein [Actinomyces urogenitalis]